MNYFPVLLLLIVFTSLEVISEDEKSPPILKILQGELQGTYLRSRDGKTYSAFMGIPYANPPEKFELAKPAKEWKGVRDATKFGSICPQINVVSQKEDKFEGDEDCLFANVFTPDMQGKLPVMVFIHGGGFQFGNSDENGADYFMDEKVVLVTINYRLGALGFLSTGDEILPGNLGLKDQLLALKWVQQNIMFFGGDPRRVTLFGESAGGASVSYHVISKASEGLFQSAICQSGTALNPWAFVENPKPLALRLAEKLGCPTSGTSRDLKICLKTKTPRDIISNDPWTSVPIANPTYLPTTELPSDTAFIVESPHESYKNKRFSKVPLLVTITEKEGLLIHAASVVMNEQLRNQINENWMTMAPNLFNYDYPNVPQEAKDTISNKLKKFYLKDKLISEETMEQLGDLYADSHFVYGIRNTILAHASSADVYTAVFAYQNAKWSILFNFGFTKFLGMTHADDLPYLFSAEKYPKFERKSQQEMVSKLCVQAFAAFAEHGNPNFQKAGVSWKPVTENEITSKKLKWLYVKFPPKVQDGPFPERMALWDRIHEKLNKSMKIEEKKVEL